MEGIDSRSIIIGGITEDLPLEMLIKHLHSNDDSSRIENVEVYDYDKIRLTYFSKEEVEKILETNGGHMQLENFKLSISKPTKDHKLQQFLMSSHSSSSTKSATNTDNSVFTSGSNQDLQRRIIDTRRVLVTNIPVDVTYEHLLLYLEYLSDEIGIEHVDDASKDVKNSILVKFNGPIDFESMKEKHSNRPTFMTHTTELLQIYEPKKIAVSAEVAGKEILSAEILELYFSNKKRSGGENIQHIEMNEEYTDAVIAFADTNVAQYVATQKHQIDKTRVKVRLVYEVSTKNHPIQRDFTSTSKEHREKENPQAKSDLENLENTFDASQLNEQQTKYLLGLQSIYNELNNTSLNLFKEEPVSSAPDDDLTEDNQIFSYYFTERADKPKASVDALLSLPKPSYLNNWNHFVVDERSPPTVTEEPTDKPEFFGTLSHAEADAQYASSVIDNSFKGIIDNVECPLSPLETHRQLEASINDIMTLINPPHTEKSPSVIDEPVTKKEASRKKLIPLRLVRRYQMSKKNKNQAPIVITKDKVNKPPPPKVVKFKHDDSTDEELLNAHNPDKDTKRSQSTFSNPNYLPESTSRSQSTASKNSTDQEATRSKSFEVKRSEMASLPDLNKLAKQPNKSHFQVDLAKRNIQSLYGKDTLSTSIDKLSPMQIGFFRTSKYLQVLGGIYTKVKFNLNENLRNVYLFGTAGQVSEAKEKIQKDIELLKEVRYPLKDKDIATFLKKPEIKQKIFMFIQTLLNRHTYQRAKGSVKPRDILKEETLVKYCTYEVASEAVMTRVNGKQENVVNISNSLVVSTNLEHAGEVVKKFIDESIVVGRVHGIKSRTIVEYIKNSRPEWTDFYEELYKNKIDFNLKERIMISKSYSRATKSSKSDKSWELRLTGFREEVEEFVREFDAHFALIKLKKEKLTKKI